MAFCEFADFMQFLHVIGDNLDFNDLFYNNLYNNLYYNNDDDEEYTSIDESSSENKKRSDVNEDLISKLPDEILVKILSIHPFDSASKAVALLTGLWNRPQIKHGRGRIDAQDLESAVGELILSFDKKNPLKNPRRLEFHFNQGLILSATLGLKEKLHLDFSKGKEVFPRQFAWGLVLNTMDFPQPSPYPFYVKTLKLTSVNYETEKYISSLISKFRYVESLIIEKCHGLQALRIDALAKLVKLTVRDCPGIKSVFIEALEIQSLRYQGQVCWFSVENVKYLKDVMLDIRGGTGYKNLHHQDYNCLLRAIRDVEVLTLNAWIFKEVLGPLLSSEKHKLHFRFCKLEDLWWIDTSMEDYNINSLFSFLKFCPSLKRLFISVKPRSYSMARTLSGDQRANKVQEGGRLRKLKVVKLEGLDNKEDIIFLKEQLLKVFNVEPPVITVSRGSHCQCLIRIPKCQIADKLKEKATESQKWKFCYKFVEEVEDHKHAHMGSF